MSHTILTYFRPEEDCAPTSMSWEPSPPIALPWMDQAKEPSLPTALPRMDQAKEKKGKASRRSGARKFIDDQAELSGSDKGEGDPDLSDEQPDTEDEAMINDVPSEEEEQERVKLSKKEKRLTKDDLLLVRDARRSRRAEAGLPSRRRVLDDEDEDEDDMFVDEDDEEEDYSVRMQVRDAMRENGLMAKGDEDDERSVALSDKVPFGLRDEASGLVRNGRTGEVLRAGRTEEVSKAGKLGEVSRAGRTGEVSRAGRLGDVVPMPAPAKLPPTARPPEATSKLSVKEQADLAYRNTLEHLEKKSAIVFKDAVAGDGCADLHLPSYFQAPAKKLPVCKPLTSHRPGCTPLSSSRTAASPLSPKRTAASSKEKQAHLPACLRKDAGGGAFKEVMGAAKKRRGGGPKPAKAIEVGVFRCKDSGKLYYRGPDGRVTPSD